MYVLDYLIYHLRPYGIVSHAQPLRERLTIEAVIAEAADAKTQHGIETLSSAAKEAAKLVTKNATKTSDGAQQTAKVETT